MTVCNPLNYRHLNLMDGMGKVHKIQRDREDIDPNGVKIGLLGGSQVHMMGLERKRRLG